MTSTFEDQAVFSKIRDIFRESGLPVEEEGQDANYLYLRSGLFAGEVGKGGKLLDADLTLAYEVRLKAIRIEAFFPIPVPLDRNMPLLDLFNDLNNNLVNTRLHLNLGTRIISLRGTMSLFGEPLNEEHFKITLDIFVQTLNDFFPTIYDFLEGKVTKQDIQKKFNSKAKEPPENEQISKGDGASG